MGVSELEQYFSVIVLDCTAWLMPGALLTRGAAPQVSANVQKIDSLHQLKGYLGKVHGGYAVDYVGQFSPAAVLMFNELKRHHLELIVVDSGAYPAPDLIVRPRGVVQKIFDAIRHGGLMLHINAILIRALLRFLPDQRPDYALVSGHSWQSDARFRAAKNIIPAHSFDYETSLKIASDARLFSDDFAVYLDEDITGHEDNSELGFSEPATALNFYPALLAYFESFEQKTGLKIIVAGYPSASGKAREHLFGGRPVIYGKTALLVRDAKLVMAHASTAISYAVLARCPLIFLTSKEIRQSWYQVWIEAPQKLLNAPMVDIDSIDSIDKGSCMNECDENGYINYMHSYIKTTDSPAKSLWDIFSSIILLPGPCR